MTKVLIDNDVAIDFLRGDHKARKVIEHLWYSNNAYLSLLLNSIKDWKEIS